MRNMFFVIAIILNLIILQNQDKTFYINNMDTKKYKYRNNTIKCENANNANKRIQGI